jgi:hypothetical protein
VLFTSQYNTNVKIIVMHHIINNVAGALYNWRMKHKNADKNTHEDYKFNIISVEMNVKTALF